MTGTMVLKRLLDECRIIYQSLKKLKKVVLKANVKMWMIRVVTTVLLWTCFFQLSTILEMWHPKLLEGWNSCFRSQDFPPTTVKIPPVKSEFSAQLSRWFDDYKFVFDYSTLEPKSHSFGFSIILRSTTSAGTYQNNGYLMVSSNGGLNQMRAGICDMVTVARYLNLTLIVPELDKRSFWADPSEFQDIFDVQNFITSLRDEVQILRELPESLKMKVATGKPFTLPPVSWSDMSYYVNQILPLMKKHKVVHFNKTDGRLANNGLPLEIQKLRCRVNYNALRYTPQIEELGRRVIRILRKNGPFLVLHLRYEMDMLSFSGCTRGCDAQEVKELTTMRNDNPLWKEKIIDSEQKRKEGLCPLTPDETALTLRALGIDRNVQIYIAAGKIYGGKRRLASLAAAFPNLVGKETLLRPSDLGFFMNHSNQMAALDYLVSLESDIFVPTYDGNMAKVVEGHRRFLGFKRTILLDKKFLVEFIDSYKNGSLSWDEFSTAVKEAHAHRMGSPKRRAVIPDSPKQEDYFYANPHECLQLLDDQQVIHDQR